MQASSVDLITKQCTGFRIKLLQNSEVQHEERRRSGLVEMVC